MMFKKKLIVPVLAGLMLFQTGCSAGEIESLKNDIIKDIYSDDDEDTAYDDLDTGLYQEISAENKGKSFVFSPYSIKDCITLAYDGMSDAAKKELVSLGVDSNDIEEIKKLDKKCKNAENISIADKVFYNKISERTINKDLIRKDAEQSVDMNVPVGAAGIINRWADKNTHGKIPEIVSPDSINEDTSMILCNAIWMKARWKYESSYDNAGNGIKWTDGNRYKNFYGDLDIKNVRKADGAVIAKLPYRPKKGLNLSMYVILPDEKTDTAVDDWMKEHKNSLKDLLDLDGNDGPEGYDEASFDIPDFEMTWKDQDMLSVLNAVGLDKKFTDTKDLRYGTYKKLSNDPSRGFYVSDLSHAAYIKTDIHGTEAAAASAEYMTDAVTAVIKNTFDVRCDHPFAFVVKEEQSGQFLFMGKVGKDVLTKA